MGKIFGFVYGLTAYLLFVLVFLYAVGFVADWLVPRSIDSGEAGDLLYMPHLLVGLCPAC